MKKNLAPVIAIFGGMLLIIYAIGNQAEPFMFWSISSIFITIFGSLAALIISYPMKYIKRYPSC